MWRRKPDVLPCFVELSNWEEAGNDFRRHFNLEVHEIRKQTKENIFFELAKNSWWILQSE